MDSSQYKYNPFCLTGKPYPEFYQFASMKCVFKSPAAHILASRWKIE